MKVADRSDEVDGEAVLVAARRRASQSKCAALRFLIHPSRFVTLVRYLRRLPEATLRVAQDPQGDIVARNFGGKLNPSRLGVQCLCLPSTLDEYLAGGKRQSLRTGINSAGRQGMTKRTLRVDEVKPAFEETCGRRRWTEETLESTITSFGAPLESLTGVVAEDADGEIITLSLWLASGTTAQLLWSMSTDGGDGRWLAWLGSVEACLALGVRTMTVNGDDYFAKLVGFQRSNVRVDVGGNDTETQPDEIQLAV